MRPDDRRYLESHEWAKQEGDLVLVGITDHAVSELNELVYLELPETGTELAAGEEFGEIESTKAVSALYMPIGGTIEAINEALKDDLDDVANDPFGKGWMIKIRPSDAGEMASSDRLLDAAGYDKTLG